MAFPKVTQLIKVKVKATKRMFFELPNAKDPSVKTQVRPMYLIIDRETISKLSF